MSGPPGLSGGIPPAHQAVTSACRPNQGGNRCRTDVFAEYAAPLQTESRNTPLTAAGNHAKDSPKSSSTPTNTALPRHLRKSGSGSPCCLPVDPERESGRGGANTASAVGFPDIECACEAAWGAPPGFWLCAAGFCREDSCRVTRRCAMVHLSECAGLWGACGKRGPWLGAAALPYSAVSPQSTLFLDCVALASLELTR